MRSVRAVLPGEPRVADPMELGAEQRPKAVGRMLSEISNERPGVLGEAGLGALQARQAISEAQGRGRGKNELAIAFTELVGFSDWALEAGDEAAVDLLRDVSVAVEPPDKSHDGTVVKRLGDGMMAVFKGVDGAIAAIEEGRDRLQDVDADGFTPRIRAGVHCGKPRKVDRDYFGVDVNITARVADRAGPGELLLSGAALDSATGDGLTVSDRRPLDAKGVPEEFPVYAVALRG
ncbi:MAG: adenylate/guanylate cyclase domain-containing protein [Actinobacteria bacterium]|nr:adenylate/guanylate cyclase domain-containing protein [Actinomycetota bacterium]